MSLFRDAVDLLGKNDALFGLQSVLNLMNSWCKDGTIFTFSSTVFYVDSLMNSGVLERVVVDTHVLYRVRSGSKYYSKSKGEWLFISDMNTKHIANAIKHLYTGNFVAGGSEQFTALVDELESRAHLVEPAT